MEIKNFEIDGIKGVIHPFKPRLCMRLDKKISSLVLHVLGGKEEINFTNIEEIDVNAIINNLAGALDNLSDDEYEKTVVELLSSTVIDRQGRQPIQITDGNSFDEAFTGVKPITINKVLLEVMKVNSFTPFDIAVTMGILQDIPGLSGNQTTKTHT